MALTVLDVDPNTYPVTVTVARPDTSALSAQGDVLNDHSFGVTPAGVAYFDPSGADPGDIAALGYDGSVDRFFLNGPGLAAPDLHLMRLCQAERAESRLAAAQPDPSIAGAGQIARAAARFTAPRNAAPAISATRSQRWAASRPEETNQ
jgi:hypothetical protein